MQNKNYSTATNTVFVNGEPRHCGQDVQALMSLAKSMYAFGDNDILVCCPEFPEHSGRLVWMRFDKTSATWVEAAAP